VDVSDAATGVRAAISGPLKRFVWDIQSIVELAESERGTLMIGRDLMTRLLAERDWLPPVFAVPSSRGAARYLVYQDAMARFCVVSTLLAERATLRVAQPAIWEIMGVVDGVVAHDGRARAVGAVETRRASDGAVVALTGAAPGVSIALHVYGGGLDGLAAGGYANSETAPPYDIFSIQTRIED
jgi:predicted metal-dependent enzyme (double-stranded beta helix superfamily)